MASQSCKISSLVVVLIAKDSQIGLSQVRNLLYVAYVDKIHVYRPDYPQQTLSDNPLLVLSPPRTPSATHGFIDARFPHSINHLIVDFLGELEIVLVACDDGDVIAYYTHEIQAAIERRDESDGPDSIEGFEVRAFFQQNVSKSAWGLSIHTKARKIAVSANTHQVTVFPFGLATSKCDDDEELLSDKPLDKIILNDPANRDSDQKFVLAPMNNNVPAIAFCNTEDDPEGRLLVSGEILGSIYLWDLHHLELIQLIRAEYCVFSEGKTCACDQREQYPHAIWGLTWLDKKSFRKFKKYAPPSEDIFSSYWDGSNARWMVPEANSDYTFLRARRRAPSPMPIHSDSEGSSDDDAMDDDQSENTAVDTLVPVVTPNSVDFSRKLLHEQNILNAVRERNHPWSGEPAVSS
jgi:hypothetical protein